MSRRLNISNAASKFGTRGALCLFACCLAALAFFRASAGWGYTDEDCIRCHREGSRGSSLAIPVDAFKASAHKGLGCQDCHTEVKDETHRRMKTAGRVDCSQCHDQVNRHGMNSTGGLRPRCDDCHTKHAILPKDDANSSVHPDRLKAACRRCHPVETGRTGYLSWFPSLQIKSHKKEDFSLAYDRGDCIGCHQGQAAHGEASLLDRQDCYRCHLPRDGRSPLWGTIHPKADARKQPGIFATALLYQVFLVGILWGGFRFYARRASGRKKNRGDR